MVYGCSYLKKSGEEGEKRKGGKKRREKEEKRFLFAVTEYFKIKHPQRRVPSEARDVAAAEKKFLG